jgi:hypothetical protein
MIVVIVVVRGRLAGGRVDGHSADRIARNRVRCFMRMVMVLVAVIHGFFLRLSNVVTAR